jgi:hypothetical protein
MVVSMMTAIKLITEDTVVVGNTLFSVFPDYTVVEVKIVAITECGDVTTIEVLYVDERGHKLHIHRDFTHLSLIDGEHANGHLYVKEKTQKGLPFRGSLLMKRHC